MNNKTHLLCYLSIALMSFSIVLSNTYGTMLRKMDTTDLTNDSSTIVVGKVTSMKSEWNSEGTEIYTYITVAVDQCLKGSLQHSEITIKQLGGEVAGIGLKVVGAPEYKEGEEVLTFLKGSESDNFQCVGMAQGKYTIITDYSTQKKTLIREIDKFDNKRPDLKNQEGAERKLFLNDIVNQIKTIVEEEQE